MRLSALALLILLAPWVAAQETASDSAEEATAEAADDLQKQRETLLLELQRLRSALEQSDARMEASQARIRELQSQSGESKP